MDSEPRVPLKIHLVSTPDSPEFARFTRALTRSSVIGLDAEWKPARAPHPESNFPTVTLLQLACRPALRAAALEEPAVFLLDLSSIPLPSVWELLRDVFASPDVLKLGFRFKQDLIFLSSTFCSQGCDPGFDRVEPYIDIMGVHNILRQKQSGRKTANVSKSLAAICEELLGYSLSKELQCSDWSQRPLTEEQKEYAARDALCLLEIFSVFQAKIINKGKCLNGHVVLHSDHMNLGLKEVLKEPDTCSAILRIKSFEALHIVRTTAAEFPHGIVTADEASFRPSFRSTEPMDEALLLVVRKFGEKISLKESDRRPKASKKKGRKRSSLNSASKEKRETFDEWQGPAPWDISTDGDGCPKFLCDVMVEGLAKHLRCVGIDAAIPHSKKPEARELIAQAHKEKRVLLTRDAKLLRHEYLLQNQIYRVKSLLKNEQLLEVIEAFQLVISEDDLMSRCTKCNGRFIQKPLSTEEAVEAAKGFQRIPSCLFDKNLEFWQCMDCNQLYWEGTQYQNAVQKFIDVCKLNE
ncbi:exonuclease mut-7 homolog [Rhodamnia argentea]|uniref:Exonuclease mut-7 homolog n=1 Tax=Rhodamnia argentea TaxID=178133 RepID=A0A8B8PBS6_9MYRT|nr:exonuclease mut-7 homolog [Rhodamnia argentea]